MTPIASATSLLMMLGLVSPAAATEFQHPEAPFVATHNCTCRFNGEEVELGETRCLKTPDGSRAAQCVMEQNVTSWRTVTDACPQASLSLRGG